MQIYNLNNDTRVLEETVQKVKSIYIYSINQYVYT